MKNVIELDWRGFKFEIGVGDKIYIDSSSLEEIIEIDEEDRTFRVKKKSHMRVKRGVIWNGIVKNFQTES